jgi:chromosome segregation ATPase
MEPSQMESEQIIKRLEWLDEERRKDKAAIAALEQRLAGYEGSQALLKDQIKELETRLSRFSSVTARMDQFDGVISQQRIDVTHKIEDVEKKRDKDIREAEVRRHTEIDNVNKSIVDLRKALDVIPDLRKQIQSRSDAETRFSRAITDLEAKIQDAIRASDEVRMVTRTLEENRKNDIKRVTEAQGEVAAVRKRIEEQREKNDINTDTIKHLDTRINELLSTEAERRQSQRVFIEQQSLNLVERDRTWKEIQVRFESFAKQATGLDATILSLEETQRVVKKSKEIFDDLNTRIERRVTEITEMQRLTEDRMRQEWITFKSDDQKRWTNYTLSQDENFREIRADLEKFTERIASLDDAAQNQADLLQQTTETTEKSLQELMNWAHAFLSDYERVMGRSRPNR